MFLGRDTSSLVAIIVFIFFWPFDEKVKAHMYTSGMVNIFYPIWLRCVGILRRIVRYVVFEWICVQTRVSKIRFLSRSGEV